MKLFIFMSLWYLADIVYIALAKDYSYRVEVITALTLMYIIYFFYVLNNITGYKFKYLIVQLLAFILYGIREGDRVLFTTENGVGYYKVESFYCTFFNKKVRYVPDNFFQIGVYLELRDTDEVFEFPSITAVKRVRS